MGRWRPPAESSSPYITKDGYAALEQEHESLWTKRAEVTKAVAAAAAEGDRSENAEYIYRKKQLREIDRRITYLQKRMPKLTVVEQKPDAERIFFAAWVKLEDVNGMQTTYRIVGADEIDQHQNAISVDAPLSKALLGKSPGDEIVISLADVEHQYFILDVRYEP